MDDFRNHTDRLGKLEDAVRQNTEDIDDLGGTVDHLVNTVDSILLPNQQRHEELIKAQVARADEAHDYIVSQKGAWQFIQRVGVVIAALSSAVVLVMKLTGK